MLVSRRVSVNSKQILNQNPDWLAGFVKQINMQKPILFIQINSPNLIQISISAFPSANLFRNSLIRVDSRAHPEHPEFWLGIDDWEKQQIKVRLLGIPGFPKTVIETSRWRWLVPFGFFGHVLFPPWWQPELREIRRYITSWGWYSLSNYCNWVVYIPGGAQDFWSINSTPPKINSLNLKMIGWKMIFLFQGCILRFHVNLPGCISNQSTLWFTDSSGKGARGDRPTHLSWRSEGGTGSGASSFYHVL